MCVKLPTLLASLIRVVHLFLLTYLRWNIIITKMSSFIVYRRVHTCKFYGFGQIYNSACIHHYSIFQGSCAALEILCASTFHPLFPTNILAVTGVFTISVVLLVPECHIVGIIVFILSLSFTVSKSNPQSSKHLINIFFPLKCNLQTFWFRIT